MQARVQAGTQANADKADKGGEVKDRQAGLSTATLDTTRDVPSPISPPAAPISPPISGNHPISPISISPLPPGPKSARSTEKQGEIEGSTPYSKDQELEIALLFAGAGAVCNGCGAAEVCSEYKPGMECAYDGDFAGLTSRREDNLLPRQELIADLQMKRAVKAVFFESRKAGGQLDPAVSRQLEIAAAATERVRQLKQPLVQKASQSVTVMQKSQASGGGILSRLIGNMMPQPQPALVLNEPSNNSLTNSLSSQDAPQSTIVMHVEETTHTEVKPRIPQSKAVGDDFDPEG